MKRTDPLPLTRAQLDDLICKCGKPSCKVDPHLFLKAACHQQGVEACFDKRDGILTIRCYVCLKPVARIKVAKSLFEL